MDSQLPCSSAVSRQAKTFYECVYGAIRHQKGHRQETGQYSSSRIWVSTQSPNFSAVHTGANFGFMRPFSLGQAHISLKCMQVAHDRGTSRISPARLANSICRKPQLRLQSHREDAGNNVSA